MKFTPKYTVSYKGTFHKAGIAFQVDSKDAEMMSAHGVVAALAKPVQARTEPTETVKASAPSPPDKPARRAGRPKKEG